MVGNDSDADRLKRRLERKLGALLKAARAPVNQFNWDSRRFDQKKSACLALFSEIAYYKINEEEYRRPERAKIVPCAAYGLAITRGIRLDFGGIARVMDFDNIDVIQTRHFVAIIFYLQEVVIVAVRGTVFWYDWKQNFRANKSTYRDWNNGSLVVSRGLPA